jgi:hypothetical protein
LELKTSPVILSSSAGEHVWTPKVGAASSFYHEGGTGDKYWAGGWRYGIIKYIPTKGQRLGWAELEIPVDLYGKDDRGRYVLKPRLKAWCHLQAVNAPGDFLYHGRSIKEEVQERREEKQIQQAKADKRKRKGRA